LESGLAVARSVGENRESLAETGVGVLVVVSDAAATIVEVAVANTANTSAVSTVILFQYVVNGLISRFSFFYSVSRSV
jgi:hypothetical protein